MIHRFPYLFKFVYKYINSKHKLKKKKQLNLNCIKTLGASKNLWKIKNLFLK